ncbi:4-amino-4-deoxy-L-arabinose transferase [Candidatus Margulisiibacteriota bacterium]
MGNYIMLAVSITMAAAGQILMKQGMRMVGVFPVREIFSRMFSIIFNPFVFLGLSMFALSSIVWLVVLSRMELSYVYPMVSIAYIIVAIVAYFLLGEKVVFIRWLGILTICLGVFLISRS